MKPHQFCCGPNRTTDVQSGTTEPASDGSGSTSKSGNLIFIHFVVVDPLGWLTVMLVVITDNYLSSFRSLVGP